MPRKPSIPQKMRAKLLEMGYGARVTGQELCHMYVAVGGTPNNSARPRDLGLGSVLFRVQYVLPIKMVEGDAKFGVKNVYEVDREAETELQGMDDRKKRPKQIWDSLALSLEEET